MSEYESDFDDFDSPPKSQKKEKEPEIKEFSIGDNPSNNEKAMNFPGSQVFNTIFIFRKMKPWIWLLINFQRKAFFTWNLKNLFKVTFIW